MRTLQHHAAIATDLASLHSRISALNNSFAVLEERNAADEALIALMLQQSAALTQAAQELLSVVYDPTPAEPEAP